MHAELMKYVQQNDWILPREQFAYRAHHSCEDALTSVIDDWCSDLDKGNVVGIILADLTKAFDSVLACLRLQ